MSVNSYQINGDHYLIEYQPWDFFIDTNLHFILASAIKYIARYKKKHGINDLRKAVHYLQKATDCEIPPPEIDNPECVKRFTDQLNIFESLVIRDITCGFYQPAILSINRLINELICLDSRNNEGETPCH